MRMSLKLTVRLRDVLAQHLAFHGVAEHRALDARRCHHSAVFHAGCRRRFHEIAQILVCRERLADIARAREKAAAAASAPSCPASVQCRRGIWLTAPCA